MIQNPEYYTNSKTTTEQKAVTASTKGAKTAKSSLASTASLRKSSAMKSAVGKSSASVPAGKSESLAGPIAEGKSAEIVSATSTANSGRSSFKRGGKTVATEVPFAIAMTRDAKAVAAAQMLAGGNSGLGMKIANTVGLAAKTTGANTVSNSMKKQTTMKSNGVKAMKWTLKKIVDARKRQKTKNARKNSKATDLKQAKAPNSKATGAKQTASTKTSGKGAKVAGAKGKGKATVMKSGRKK